MKEKLLIVTLILFTLSISAQNDTTWKKGGKFALTFSQVAFTNWAAGGENSYGGNGFFLLFAHYKEGKRMWDTDLNLAYGLMKLDGESTRKTDDKIDFTTKYGHEISKNLYLSSNFNFNTQFSPGYKYPNDSVMVSTFMAPGYIQLGVGIDYKPVEYFSLSFLPVTARMTIVSDQQLANIGAYGVDPAVVDTNGNIITQGKQTRFELGAAVIAVFQKELIKNVELKSKLQLFSNYLEHPENIDVNWDSMLSLKVNKYISTFVGLTLLYDDDISILQKNGEYGPRTQFKQTFGLGLAMDF
jgi:hypothetical protein